MNCYENVKFLFDISSVEKFTKIKKHVSEFDFLEDTELQFPYFDPAFKDSYILFLRESILMQHVRMVTSRRKKPVYTGKSLILANDVDSLIDLVYSYFPDHYFLKSHIVALKPGGSQIKHIDELPYHSMARRLVLPIQSTDSQTYVSDKFHTFVEGHVYEMNNVVEHYSINTGNNIRVTLFIDIIPPEILPEAMKFYNAKKC
jgi:hypothetical protein